MYVCIHFCHQLMSVKLKMEAVNKSVWTHFPLINVLVTMGMHWMQIVEDA